MHVFLGLAKALQQVNLAFCGKAPAPLISRPEYELFFERVLNGSSRVVFLGALWLDKFKDATALGGLEMALTRTIQVLEAGGKQVYVLEDLPRFPFDPQRCKFSRPISGTSTCTVPRSEFEARQNKYLPLLQWAVATSGSARLLSLAGVVCDAQFCWMGRDGEIFFWDKNHLNISGSTLVTRELLPQLGQWAYPAKESAVAKP